MGTCSSIRRRAWLLSLAAMLIALAIPASASAVVDHKGLDPSTPVPEWAKHTAVHFMPWEENPSAVKSQGHAQSKPAAKELLAGSTSTAGEPPLMYYGNEGVQDTPHIYPIFWGSNWNKEPGVAVRAQLMKMYEGLSGSAYQGILTQYFDATGRISSTVAVSPAYIDTSVAAPSNVSSKNIEEEAARAIKANGWSHDFNSQFVVLTAPGSTYVIENYCAFHAFRKIDSSEIYVPYAFVPYEGDPPLKEHCLSHDPKEDATNSTVFNASHEYAETATDPGASTIKGAWRTHDGLLYEIADMCEIMGVTLPNGSFVSPLWDDHQSGCSTSDPNPPFVFGVSEPPTGVGVSTATLHGTVNPEGPETKYQFEYDTAEYKNGEGPHGTKVPASMTPAGSGMSNIPESYALTGLPHGATYHYRLVATNSSGTTYGEDKKFETERTKPIVQTTPATGLSTSGATLNGTVNPNGLATKYYFEYAPKPLIITKESERIKTAEVSAGSGTTALTVATALSGLTANTDYYFRIAASNADGVTTGLESTFYSGAPKNTALPVATPAVPAQTVPVSVTTGEWKGHPTTFGYQWELCTGAVCEPIAGATGASYVPVAKDVGHTLVAKVTATNTIGSATAAAAATGEVKPIGQVTEYALPAGSKPYDIVSAWVDKQLWFTYWGGAKLGKMTTAGALTELSQPGLWPRGIASGASISNSSIWTANSVNSSVAKFSSGVKTEYLTPNGGEATDIALGPENNMWFTLDSPDEIGKTTTAGAMTTYPLPEGSEPTGITAGPDGNIWFTYWGTNKIGKITPSGTITTYPVSSSHPDYITTGPDGNLWFTTGAGKVGRITTSGTVTEYTVGSAAGIVAGPDGNLWFASQLGNSVTRITTSGSVTSYPVAAGCEPLNIAVGSDMNLWFTCFGSGKIGKMIP